MWSGVRTGNIERIEQIDEIYVIGHSVAEVDLPYFRYIENCTHRQSNWIVYFFNKEEKEEYIKTWWILVFRKVDSNERS